MARETNVKCRSPSTKHMKIFNFVRLLTRQQVQDGTTITIILEESYTFVYYYYY